MGAQVSTMSNEVDRFTLTTDHVQLLRAANVGWHHSEWGAPCIDGKRPYGNGDLYDDIASLTGMAVECDHCGHNVLGENDRAHLDALHKSMKTALQVVLSSGSFEPGEYVSPKYGHNWRRAK